MVKIFIIFSTESNIDIEVLDIPVNAVATALKDFFSKHLRPIFDMEMMSELEDIAGELNNYKTKIVFLNLRFVPDKILIEKSFH